MIQTQESAISNNMPSSNMDTDSVPTLVQNDVSKANIGSSPVPTKRSPSGYNLFFHMVRDDILLFHKDKSVHTGSDINKEHPIFSDKNEDALNYILYTFNPNRIEEAAIALRTKPKRKHIKIDNFPISFRALTNIVSTQWQNLLPSIKQMFLSQASAESDHYHKHQQTPIPNRRQRQKQQRNKNNKSVGTVNASMTKMTDTKHQSEVGFVVENNNMNTLDGDSIILYENTFDDLCFNPISEDEQFLEREFSGNDYQNRMEDKIHIKVPKHNFSNHIVSPDSSKKILQYRNAQVIQKKIMMKKLQQQQVMMKDHVLQQSIMKKLQQQQQMMKAMYICRSNNNNIIGNKNTNEEQHQPHNVISQLANNKLYKMQKFQQLSLQNKRTMMMFYMQKQKQRKEQFQQQQMFQKNNLVLPSNPAVVMSQFLPNMYNPTNMIHFNSEIEIENEIY